MIDMPAITRPFFLDAGWRPGRLVSVSARVPVDHPALLVLSELGGLRVGRVGLGEKTANDIAFQKLEPYEKIVKVWGELLGSRLIGIAEVHNAHEELSIDGTGRYFGASCIHDAFYFRGTSFSETIEKLLLGGRARPMLRPDQEKVMLYVQTFTAEDPEVYKYR